MITASLTYIIQSSDIYIYIYVHAQRLGFAPALQRRGFPFTFNWDDEQRYYMEYENPTPVKLYIQLGKINKGIREY